MFPRDQKLLLSSFSKFAGKGFSKTPIFFIVKCGDFYTEIAGSNCGKVFFLKEGGAAVEQEERWWPGQESNLRPSR